MDKEELKKIIVSETKELLFRFVDYYSDETLDQFADSIISKSGLNGT